MSRSTENAEPVPRKPRVLFVNTRSALGADVAVHLSLIENFDPAQVEVHIATNRNAVDLDKTLGILRKVPELKILVCDLGHEVAGQGKAGKLRGMVKNAGAIASLMRLAWYIRAHKIDILHSTDRPRDAAFSTLLAKMTGRRNVIHVHIKWYPGMGRATTWGLENSTVALAISRFTRDSLIAGGVPAAKIVTILNATDPAVFDPARAVPGALRDKFGLSPDTPLIGIVARIMVWKGQMELVNALPAVRAAFPDVRLAIVGNEDLLAAQSGESYAGQVRERIAALGLEASVFWAGWHDDMPSVMADCDVIAVPSWEEPFGLVVTEAMAMQRAVVGFDSGALPEIITPGVEGLLTPQKDVDALARALIELLRNKDRRTAMGQAGRARVLRDFTPRRQCAEVEAMYRDMLTR